MGLGRALFDEDASGGPIQLTADGAALGAPEYTAPEQSRDSHRADVRADIYSLGCVLYQALAGHPPFLDANPLRQIVHHALHEPRPLVEVNGAVSEGLQRIVSRMMAKDPAQRYQKPEQAAQALQDFLEAAPVLPPVETPKMQEYLSWVESQSSVMALPEEVKRAAAARARPATMPMIGPLEPPPRFDVPPRPPPQPERRRETPAPPRLGPPAAIPIGAAPPRPDATPLGALTQPRSPFFSKPPPAQDATPVDVEVVPFPQRPPTGFGPRDFLFLSLGAFLFLLVVGLVWLLIQALRQ